MGRRGFSVLAGVLALAGLAALGVYVLAQPRTLKLAVGPLGSADARMAAAFVQGLNREKAAIRIKLVLTEGSAESARRVDAGETELAIVRPHISLPAKADTALITARTLPFFIAAKDKAIERISELRGRRIGIVRSPAGNSDLLGVVLAQYEVGLDEVTVVPLGADDVVPAAQEGRIDVLFAINAVGARSVSDGASRLRTAFGGDPAIIPVREAAAIAARHPTVETGEILRGALGGDPPRPAENLPTISVTSRLVAAQDLDEALVGELVSLLLGLRVTLAAELPAIQGLEAPATDKDAALPVHPGAAAFIDGEQETFFERYGDWFYLGVMAISLLGSGAAGLLGFESAARRRRAMDGLGRLVELLSAIRTAEDETRLAGIEREADAVLAEVLASYSRGDIDSGGVGAYRLAMDQLGRAVAERRLAFSDAAPAASPA